jgi:hypothetical protein
MQITFKTLLILFLFCYLGSAQSQFGLGKDPAQSLINVPDINTYLRLISGLSPKELKKMKPSDFIQYMYDKFYQSGEQFFENLEDVNDNRSNNLESLNELLKSFGSLLENNVLLNQLDALYPNAYAMLSDSYMMLLVLQNALNPNNPLTYRNKAATTLK